MIRKRQYVFIVAILLAAWIVLEGTIWVGLTVLKKFYYIQYNPVISDRLSERHEQGIRALLEELIRYFGFSSVLGWTINPNVKAGIYVSNSQGFRGDRGYSPVPPGGILRISTFGDSMTHCDEVKNQETWPAQLEGLEPGFEVLSFGVSASGLDQAYLRYLHEGKRFRPHIVFIGFQSENIFRIVNVFRPFYYQRTGFPMEKPRFLLAGNGLELFENPLPTLKSYKRLLKHPKEVLEALGEQDYYFRTRYHWDLFRILPSVRAFRSAVDTLWGDGIVLKGWMQEDGIPQYDTDSEAYKVLVRLLDKFYAEVQKSGSQPIVLLLPRKCDLETFLEHGTTRYRPLIKHLELKGYLYANVAEAFENGVQRKDIESFFGYTHYSPLGNRLVAKHLQMYLRANKLIKHQGVVNASQLKQQ